VHDFTVIAPESLSNIATEQNWIDFARAQHRRTG
jgi:hypothetical protein